MGMNLVRRHAAAPAREFGGEAKRCAFTGYRPQKLPFGFNENDPRCEAFRVKLKGKLEWLILRGYSHFLAGGAIGVDMIAAEAVIELRKKYPHIALEMVIPFDGQSDKWDDEYKSRYRTLLNEADIITYTGHAYNRAGMFIRNRYLVCNADLVLAAYDGQFGGTAMTIRYAQELDIPVMMIPPETKKLELQIPA